MKYRNTEADDKIREMEDIISKDDFSYEDDERLDELYNEVKENLARDYDDGSIEHNSLKKRFRDVCREFDTPDDVREREMDNMFPDGEGMEGFDWTLED